ncbi:hypothetical protein HZC21_02665 [Candidatus Peregrinibacteria bacterium]|nr:hypothetical protein [Candidatus Peregrinibacteria bacterium]
MKNCAPEHEISREKLEISARIEKTLRDFFADCRIVVPPDDLSQIISYTIDAALQSEEISERDEIFVLRALAADFRSKVRPELINGNFFEALRFLTLTIGCFKLTKIEIPDDLYNEYRLISRRLVTGGRFELLLRYTENMLAPMFARDTAMGAESNETGSLLNEAQRAESAQNWTLSVGLRRQLIEIKPWHPANYLFLSFALEQLGQYEEALEAFVSATRLPSYLKKEGRKDEKRIEFLRRKIEEKQRGQTPLEARPQAETPMRPEISKKITFGNFLETFVRVVESWPAADGAGEDWHTVPEEEKAALEKILTAFQKTLRNNKLLPTGKPLDKKLDTIIKEVQQGSVNIHALNSLIRYADGPAKGVNIDIPDVR